MYLDQKKTIQDAPMLTESDFKQNSKNRYNLRKWLFKIWKRIVLSTNIRQQLD